MPRFCFFSLVVTELPISFHYRIVTFLLEYSYSQNQRVASFVILEQHGLKIAFSMVVQGLTFAAKPLHILVIFWVADV